jgi:hypothetical protein
MKKKIQKVIRDFEYKRYMWTCNKAFYPDASFFQLVALYRAMMKEAKSAKIQRIDNLEEYMKEQNGKD